MDETTCKKYLDMIQRDGYTVGADTLDSIEIDGTELPIGKIAFQVSSQGEVPDQFDVSLLDLKRELRQRKNRVVDRFEECSIEDQDQADDLAERYKTLTRTLDLLEDPGTTDVEKVAKRKEKMREKKWKEFLDDVMDND